MAAYVEDVDTHPLRPCYMDVAGDGRAIDDWCDSPLSVGNVLMYYNHCMSDGGPSDFLRPERYIRSVMDHELCSPFSLKVGVCT